MATSVFLNSFKVNFAEQFKESVSEPTPNNAIYLTYGKPATWANDAAPPTANSSVSTVYEVWDNMVGGKRITGADMRHVIPRYNWTPNTSYTAYDHLNTNLFDSNTAFYVVTSDFHVYKCLSNNNGAISTVEPSTLNYNTAIVSVGDGYVWKYMYSISDQELLRYTTSDYVPVKTLTSDDGSTQWIVQENAIDGGIQAIFITNGGTGYTNASNINITISGDGSDALGTASINLSSGLVSNVTITNPGSGYTYANVSITGGGGSGATARAIIPPPGGHGSDPLYELGGSNVLINARLNNTESGQLAITHSIRQIGLLIDPIIRNSTLISSNSIFEQVYTITTTGTGSYTVGEDVYQGASFATATFKGVIVEDASGIVKISNYYGTPIAGTLIGRTSSTVRYITSDIVEPDLTKYSGKIVYADNITPIMRDADQTEEFKIVIKF